MENILKFIKTYNLYILSILLVFFFFRSCGRGSSINKLEKKIENNVVLIDSLKTVIETHKKEKLSIHMEYDYWISSKDRGPQLMELHSIVKQHIRELEK